jgi:hypothetical protein
MFPTLPKLTMRLNDNIIDEDNNNEGVPYEIKTGIKSYKNLYGKWHPPGRQDLYPIDIN